MDKETMKNDLFMPTKGVVDASDATIQADRLHFDAQGAELLGRRYYQKMTDVVGKIN